MTVVKTDDNDAYVLVNDDDNKNVVSLILLFKKMDFDVFCIKLQKNSGAKLRRCFCFVLIKEML